MTTIEKRYSDESEFLVHVTGPDELESFDSWAEAATWAHDLNTHFVERGPLPDGHVYVWAIPYRREVFEDLYKGRF